MPGVIKNIDTVKHGSIRLECDIELTSFQQIHP